MAKLPVERRGTYTGPLHRLKGKTATLRVYEETGRCLAIFDDSSTGYGDGFTDFGIDAFTLEEKQ